MKRNYLQHVSKIFATLALTVAAASCNSGEEIYGPTTPEAPVIAFNNTNSVYVTKVGKEVVITPTVKHGTDGTPDDPTYRYYYEWVIDGNTVSTDKVFRRTFTQEGEVFVTLKVKTEIVVDSKLQTANASKEARIDVNLLAPPVISFAIPETGVSVLAGVDYPFSPDVQNDEDAVFCWTLDGEEVGTENTYVFNSETAGNHTLSLYAENEDGYDLATVQIEVVDALPLQIIEPKRSAFDDPAVKFIPVGRTVYFNPIITHANSPSYVWSVDGTEQDGADGAIFSFTPAEQREYTVVLSVTDTYGQGAGAAQVTRTFTYTVECFGAESTLKRPATGNKLWNKVYEYTAAPGQFVNEPKSGYTNVTSAAAACSYAESRLSQSLYVSLGGFGGYIIVGFDHSIENKGGHQGYDFSITGNQFVGSSEPGIVWVSQDVNGDGIPNDVWYELRGSETGKPETTQNYAVTYYRPAGTKMNTLWSDSEGQSGQIDYLEEYHWQDYYYPLWVEESSYTLYGTCLKHRTTQDPSTGFWYNGEFDWGYVDNFGEDMLTDDINYEADPMKTYFKIAHAMNPDGSDADLQFVDFIKVQTGVNIKAGWLGENSTEVFGFADENP